MPLPGRRVPGGGKARQGFALIALSGRRFTMRGRGVAVKQIGQQSCPSVDFDNSRAGGKNPDVWVFDRASKRPDVWPYRYITIESFAGIAEGRKVDTAEAKQIVAELFEAVAGVKNATIPS